MSIEFESFSLYSGIILAAVRISNVILFDSIEIIKLILKGNRLFSGQLFSIYANHFTTRLFFFTFVVFIERVDLHSIQENIQDKY